MTLRRFFSISEFNNIRWQLRYLSDVWRRYLPTWRTESTEINYTVDNPLRSPDPIEISYIWKKNTSYKVEWSESKFWTAESRWIWFNWGVTSFDTMSTLCCRNPENHFFQRKMVDIKILKKSQWFQFNWGFTWPHTMNTLGVIKIL